MLMITGGRFKGRRLKLPPNPQQTRPTQSKIRNALFNSILSRIPNFESESVLDLFAGSGALGFEALSRGALKAVFVESHLPCLKILEDNAKILQVEDQCVILKQPLRQNESLTQQVLDWGPYGLVCADPPYHQGWEKTLLEHQPWDQLLKPYGFLCLETSKHAVDALPDQVGVLVKVREQHYGDTRLTHYGRTPDSPDS